MEEGKKRIKYWNKDNSMAKHLVHLRQVRTYSQNRGLEHHQHLHGAHQKISSAITSTALCPTVIDSSDICSGERVQK